MSRGILYTHLYLGDQLICNGLVREYCKTHDKVAVSCTPQFYESISFMYRDLPNLRIIQGNDGYALLFILLNTWRHGYDTVRSRGPHILIHIAIRQTSVRAKGIFI